MKALPVIAYIFIGLAKKQFELSITPMVRSLCCFNIYHVIDRKYRKSTVKLNNIIRMGHVDKICLQC